MRTRGSKLLQDSYAPHPARNLPITVVKKKGEKKLMEPIEPVTARFRFNYQFYANGLKLNILSLCAYVCKTYIVIFFSSVQSWLYASHRTYSISDGENLAWSDPFTIPSNNIMITLAGCDTDTQLPFRIFLDYVLQEEIQDYCIFCVSPAQHL